MAGAKVRWRESEEEELEVVGHGNLWFGDHGLVASADVIEPASLTELRHALARYRTRMHDGDFLLEVYDVPPEQLGEAEDLFQPGAVAIELTPARTFLVVRTVVSQEEPPLDRLEVAQILSPVLQRHQATVVELGFDHEMTGIVYDLTVEISTRGRTVGDALEIGEDLLALWDASLDGGLSPTTAMGLVAAQRPELLIGQAETEWFEAKRAPYPMGTDLGRIELAKDVSALANRPDGGLLVIGLATKKRPDGGDTVSAVHAQPMDELGARRYRQALDRWVFPPLQELQIQATEVEPQGGLLCILVPPQPESLWPFLVVGAIKEGKLVGNHFSLVRRRGDETFVDPAAAVHGLLVAGRVALAHAPRELLHLAPPGEEHDRHGRGSTAT